MTILEQRRVAAGLTQAQLAEKSGLSQSNISRIEAGHRLPKADTIRALAYGLGIDVLDLFNDFVKEASHV